MQTVSRFLEDAVTQVFIGAHALPEASYDIRPTLTSAQRSLASRLVRQRYEWRGYQTDAIGYQSEDPNRVTIAAWQGNRIAATLTLGRDSPSGLMADTLYADELGGLRHPGRLVCEVTRLAVCPDYSATGVLTKLFEAAFQYARDVFGASDAVIEVNPRHVRYYQNRMGFRQIGTVRQCQRVDAPAVLMHQTVGGMSSVFAPEKAAA